MADSSSSCEENKIANNQTYSGFQYALLAGFFAALASVFAKVAFSEEWVLSFICGTTEVDHAKPNILKERSLLPFLESLPFSSTVSCQNALILLRLLSALMIIICNAIMFRSFSKSLLLCSSAAEATITNTATNFCFTALLGWLFFNEHFSRKWFMGTTLIIIGLAIIQRNQENNRTLAS